MTVRVAIRFLAGFALLIVADLASAEERPSLEGLTAAVCAKADIDGDSYRPSVCQPRCDCLASWLSSVDTFTSCTETLPGDFEIEGEELVSTPCLDVDPPNQQFACVAPASCISSADCTAAGFPGMTCLTGACVGAPCVQTECPQFIRAVPTATLASVASVTDPGPTTCTIDGYPSSSINPKDANECLEQIAAAGLDCGFRCGNGLLDAGEGCDDGNETPGDGCDASCQVE